MTDEPRADLGLAWKDYSGALLIIRPTEAIVEVDTEFGITAAVRADVSVLDGPRAGEEHLGTLVFPRVLQSQVRPSIVSGGVVLGRLGRAPAKTGQSAPWALTAANDDDKRLGREWLTRRPAPPSP